MASSQSRSRIVLIALLSLWFSCFAMHLYQFGAGRLMDWGPTWVGGLSFSRDAAPRVIDPNAGALTASGGFVAGDRILRLGDADAVGLGGIGFMARALAQTSAEGTLRVHLERKGQEREAEVVFRPLPRAPYAALISTSFAALSVLVFLRTRDSGPGRAGVLAFLSYSIWWLPFSGGPEWLTYADFFIRTAAPAVAIPLILRTALVFPDVPNPNPRALALAWVFLPLVFLRMGFFRTIGNLVGIDLPSDLFEHMASVLGAGWGLSVLIVIAVNYRRADAIGRRQVKWVAFGIYAGCLPLLFIYIVVALDPSSGWILYRDTAMAELPLLAIPVCVLISIVRQHLFDIDRVLSVAASYTMIGVAGIATLLVLAPAMAGWVSGATGLDPNTSQVLLSLVIAGVTVPTHRRLRPQIDRVFFGERHALESGVQDLISNLSGSEDPREMFTRAGQTLDDLIHPESCVIYALVGEDYAPVFLHGKAIPSSFNEQSGLVEELSLRNEPLAGEALTRTTRRDDLSPVERASLEALAAAVIVPIRQDGPLIAFWCLGPKRSGDIYTATDLALLRAVATHLSVELSRFTEVELQRNRTEMYESLRRYVPRAITEELESGRSIEPTRRDVSVMFVDIRGYTKYAEDMGPEEIFSTLSRFTELVSGIVGEHGGSLVEFSGDGIMAVFGAPKELPEKELSALRTAREVALAMTKFVARPDAEHQRLEVGIGVATGDALVGNIRSVDRLIWSAIGNTTNLAARLQTLTRDMEVGIVIDVATQRAASEETADFDHHAAVKIRGRRDRFDIYTLPRRVASSHLRQVG